MKMEEQVITYKRRGGVDGSHGHNFEWAVTTLAYLRCQRLHEQWKKDGKNGIKSFILANNVDGAGSFDDIVVRVEYVVDSVIKNKVIFVQCKHVADACKTPKEKFHTLLSKEKPFENYFSTFVDIQRKREEMKNELFTSETNKANYPSEQNNNNLRQFLDCKDLEIEVLFYSNIDIDIEHDCELGFYKPQNYIDSDITSNIFNTAQCDRFRLKLSKSKFPPILSDKFRDVKTIVKSNYCSNFQVFINQSDQLEILIDQEIEFVTKSRADFEYLRSLTVQEVENIFTAPHFSTALTEKYSLLQNVRNFKDLMKNSTMVIDHFRQTFMVHNLFCGKISENIQTTLSSKNLICIETPFLKLEKLKFLQVFSSLDNENKYIFIESVSDFEQWISARKTQSYGILKKVYIYSEICLNLPADTIKANEIVIQILKCDGQQTAWRDSLDYFSEETNRFILNKNICFQGIQLDIESFCCDTWKEVFDQEVLCDILANKPIIVGIQTLPKSDFYIDRHFKMVTVKQEYLKEEAMELNIDNARYILFSERKICIPGQKTFLRYFENLETVKRFVQKIAWTNEDTFHLCSCCNEEMVWLYSFGKLSDFFLYETLTQDSLLNINGTKITIVSDVAGMGKTSTLLSLAHIYKQHNPSHWVFFVELSMYLDKFENINKFSDTASAISFVASTILEFKGIELDLFVDACTKSGNVGLYFDGFDEISDAGDIMNSLLFILKRTKINRIFVSCRTSYVHELEENLLQKAVYFQGFTTAEKERALEECWKQMSYKSNECIGKLSKQAAHKIIESLELEKDVLHDILAIPLQIKMVANIYYDLLLTLNEEEIVTYSYKLNLYSLYEQFLISYAKRFYIEKSDMSWTKMKKNQKLRIIQEKLKGAEELACSFIMPELFQSKDIDLDNVIAVLFDELGILTNRKPLVFIHRTIAEFLVAKYVVKEHFLKTYESQIDENIELIMITQKFMVVRKFINSYLSENSVEYKNTISNRSPEEIGFYNSPLHVAASENNIEIIKYILQYSSAHLNMGDRDGQTPLHRACSSGNTESVKLLLEYSDCLVNKFNNKGDNAFHTVSINGNAEIMKLMLNRDKDLLNAQNKSGYTALYLSCLLGKTKSVKMLLTNTECLVNIVNNVDDTVLHQVTRNVNIEIMELVLQRDDFLVNKQNKEGNTPLHIACLKFNTKPAQMLLTRSDCSVNILNIDGENALHYASSMGSVDLMEFILHRDKSLLNCQNKFGYTPLLITCMESKIEATKFLVSKSDCLVLIADFNGNNISHCAAKGGNGTLMEFVLNLEKSLINCQNSYGHTPLHIACLKYQNAAARMLLTNEECSINIVDNDGNTVLHHVARMGNSEIMKLLLNKDKNLLNKQSKTGRTPLHVACLQGRTIEAEIILTEPDCSLRIVDNDGNSVLHLASFKGQTEIMKMILQRDESLLNMQNKNGHTPLHFALSNRHSEAAKILLKRSDIAW